MLNYLLAFGQKYLDLRKLTKAEKFSIKGTWSQMNALHNPIHHPIFHFHFKKIFEVKDFEKFAYYSFFDNNLICLLS